MGCNCNKGGKASKVIYKSPTGQTTEYRTEIEAQAAKIRNGGGTYTVVAR